MKKIFMIILLPIFLASCVKDTANVYKISDSFKLNDEGVKLEGRGYGEVSKRLFVASIFENPKNYDAIYNLASIAFYKKRYAEASALMIPLYYDGYTVKGYPLYLFLAESLCLQGLNREGIRLLEMEEVDKKVYIIPASKVMLYCKGGENG